MASTYSDLKIQLMATGENSGTWGTITNTNLGTAIEEAITGSADVAFSSADVTLTLINTNETQTARNLRLNLTGTSGGNRNLIVPAIEKVYIINNGLANQVTVKNAAGTGVVVPTGKTMYVYNNGTNVVDAITHLTSLTTGALTSTSTTVLNGTTIPASKTLVDTDSAQTLTNKTLTSPTITGTGTAAFGNLSYTGTLTGGTGVINIGSGQLYKDSTAAGNIGIGTTSPNARLDVNGIVRTSAGGTGSVVVNVEDSSLCPTMTFTRNGGGTSANAFLKFKNSGGEVGQIRPDGSAYLLGNVGIGTSSPENKLHVNMGTANFGVLVESTDAGSYASFKDNTTTSNSTVAIGAAGDNLLAFAGAAERMRILANGNVGIGTSSPSEQLFVNEFLGFRGSRGIRWRSGNTNTNGDFDFPETTSTNAAIRVFRSTNTTGIRRVQLYRGDNTATIDVELGVGGANSYFNSGNVGIGTSSPSRPLQVQSGSSTAVVGISSTDAITNSAYRATLQFTDSTWTGGADGRAGIVGFIAASGNMTVFNAKNSALEFGTNGAERARIDASGNLLVGQSSTTAPGVNNTTTGHAFRENGQSFSSTTSNTAGFFNRNTTNGDILSFRREGVGVGTISVTTTATAYNTSSDYRLKENIVDAPSVSESIDAIQIRSFDWKADGSHQTYGVIAQELEAIAPEAVSKGAKEDDMWGVDYSKLVPMMVKAIQELKAEIAILKGNQNA